MSDEQAPYEFTVTYPIWQWNEQRALEWVRDFLNKTESLSVSSGGGASGVGPALTIALKRTGRASV